MGKGVGEGIDLRVALDADTRIGPGKADLLEAVRETGSISAAGLRLGMSYKRAWYLIDTLNVAFREPLVLKAKGGRSGGGAHLSACGDAVLDGYRRMQAAATAATATEMADLIAMLATRQD